MQIKLDYVDYADCGVDFAAWNWFISDDFDCLEYSLCYETALDALWAAYAWLAKNERAQD